MNNFGLNREILAPIAVFAFNRPQHLQECLKSLENADFASESILYIFIDGPRFDSEEKVVGEVERVSLSPWKFKQVHIYRSKTNRGLKNSITGGINQVLNYHDSIIVVEDDLVAAKGFLLFLNLGLQRYRGYSSVASISGYQYPGLKFKTVPSFLKGADCWGWATWKDRWLSVEVNPSNIIAEIGGLAGRFKFNIFGSAPFFRILRLAQAGQVDSWAITWYGSMYLQGKLTLYPPESLITNMGADNSGTHSGNSEFFKGKSDNRTVWDFPVSIVESIGLKISIAMYFWRVKLFTYSKNLVLIFFLIIKRIFIFKNPKI